MRCCGTRKSKCKHVRITGLGTPFKSSRWTDPHYRSVCIQHKSVITDPDGRERIRDTVSACRVYSLSSGFTSHFLNVSFSFTEVIPLLSVLGIIPKDVQTFSGVFSEVSSMGSSNLIAVLVSPSSRPSKFPLRTCPGVDVELPNQEGLPFLKHLSDSQGSPLQRCILY